ncbi:MAG: glutamine amidotransferase, partial [Planctomycetaceae bacterium]
PGIVRLGTRNEEELRDGFPTTEEELFSFAAVILDDVEAEFFNHEQMALLKRFVSERGGGLLMLGGQESFAGGGYRHTPVADVLPVYVDAASAPAARPPYRLTLSREGWLEPWARLRTTEAEELERFDAMPGFKTLNHVEGVKPGGTVIARAADETGRQFPALAAQRYGRGRCAALMIGDLWRWQLARTDDSDDHDKAWRQMLRWLVSDVPDRIELTIEPRPDIAPAAVALRVRARGEDFAALDNAGVRFEITPPDGGDPIRMEAEASLDEPGAYDVVYVPRAAGAYRVAATVTDEAGEEAGVKETGWAGEPAVEEFRALTPNVALLKRLAEDTGGKVIAADGLQEFAENLATRDVPITEPWSYPLWHQSWVFLLAIACFAGEWGLRRWKGLP